MTDQQPPMKNPESSGETTSDLRDAARLARELFETSQREDANPLETLSGEEPIDSSTSILQNPLSDSGAENTPDNLVQEAYKALQLEQQARKLEEEIQTPRQQVFDPAAMHLGLFIMETQNKMVKVVDDELIVGRADSVTDYMPDIDLTPYGAYRLGLSRQHAVIYEENKTLLVKDMNSRNGTFVNGAAVPAGGTLPLHDGDVLRFGNLSLRVNFLSIEE